jgi:hypothetical protein
MSKNLSQRLGNILYLLEAFTKLDTGYWILDTGYWILVTGYYMSKFKSV